MSDRPYVSVIVPVYNGEAIVGECVEALLAQDYPRDRYEVIVVDNDSTDGTAAAIRRYPVRYVLEDGTHTSYAARNAGAAVGEGEALAFCDADQLATRGWLSSLLSHWRERELYAGFCGPYPVRAMDGSLFQRYQERQSMGAHRAGSTDREVRTCGTGNMCVAADVFRRVGGFATELRSGGDFLFSRRVSELTGRRWLWIAGALQHHRPRADLTAYARRHVRIGYGLVQRAARGERVRPLRREAAHAAWFWLRAPFLGVRALLGDGDRALEAYTLWADAVVATAQLAGRLAAHLGLPAELVSGV